MPSDPQQKPSKFYLTTPIYYVNARPHIGSAYTTIVADVLARRHRLLGHDTFFLTGTDEHGQKIERSAAAAGIPPQQFVDEVAHHFQSLWDRMGLTYDRFIRTTDPAHKRGAQKLFTDLYERGAIYLSSYTGQYCVSEEIFVEGPPGTLGPDGKPTETVTEENFFFRLSDYQRPLLDLIESDTLHITPEVRKNEVLSFLRGNTGESGTPLGSTNAGTPYVPGALRDLSVSRSSFSWGIPVPDAVQRTAGATEKHVMYVWLDALANYMTAVGYGSDDPRDQAEYQRYWPADLHLMGKEITRQHCIYWPAFLLAADLPLPKAVTAHGWLLFDNAKMSKSKGNIVRAETILDSFGSLCPPVRLPETTRNQELDVQSTVERGTASAVPSDSAGQAASAAEVRPATPAERDLFATDILRYFLLREIPFGQDGSFSFDALVTRYNADLANGYGNLVSRILSMVERYFARKIPSGSKMRRHSQDAEEHFTYGASGERASVLTAIVEHFAADLEGNRFTRALDRVQEAVARMDLYLTEQAPWRSPAGWDDTRVQERRALILYTAAEAIRIITLLLHPILPNATAKVWQQLGLGDIALATSYQPLATLLTWGGLQPGTKLGPLSPIFPRADKSLAQVMIEMEESRNTPSLKAAATPTPAAPIAPQSSDPAAAPRTSTSDPAAETSGTLPVAGSTAANATLPSTPGPHTSAPASGVFASSSQSIDTQQPSTDNPAITIDDFMKVDLRVAEILVAERIPKADKLLRLEVDLGPLGKRQILSGIAQHYTPEDLLNRRIVVVSNLAPRKMRGLDSHGMLLAASEGPDGKPILATFSEDVPLGSRVR